jgi:glycosyltransferase involved in cell wall biosynthesis
MMDAVCQREAERVRAGGGRVVFDANANYYEIWGDYVIPDTKPTERQREDALWMTRFADHVVADSTYLAGIIERITPRVTWIPDNVNLDVYAGERVHAPRRTLRLVWSGIAKKAAHLLPIGDVLAAVGGIELAIVTDRTADCLAPLEGRVPLRMIAPFSDAGYADVLRESDVIISPKTLGNGYELGHTEYKITLGMALGLPAIASPQQSYLEALADGGGIIAETPESWRTAIERLRDDVDVRRQMGGRARRTVVERYSTGTVALRYLELLDSLVRTPARVAT